MIFTIPQSVSTWLFIGLEFGLGNKHGAFLMPFLTIVFSIINLLTRQPVALQWNWNTQNPWIRLFFAEMKPQLSVWDVISARSPQKRKFDVKFEFWRLFPQEELNLLMHQIQHFVRCFAARLLLSCRKSTNKTFSRIFFHEKKNNKDGT